MEVQSFDEFKVLVKALKSVYTKDNFLPDGESIKVWYSLLRDIPYKVLHTAIQKYVMTNKFPPTISELRELCAELTFGEQKDWGDGWEQVLIAIRRHGMYNEGAALESMDDLTRQCVERLGFKNICLSENISIDRANFRQLYQSLSERRKNDEVLPLSVKTKMAELLEQNDVKRLM